jgi:hypothetical protein
MGDTEAGERERANVSRETDNRADSTDNLSMELFKMIKARAGIVRRRLGDKI